MQALEQQIRKFVVDNFMFGQDDDRLSAEASFLQKGIIDSTGVLELVMYIERDHGIKVADEELVPENLDSIRCLAQYIQRKKANGQGGPHAG